MTDKQFEKLVREARQYYGKTEGYRFKIAKIALEACDIVLGGRSPDNRFTATRFAKAIGMEPHTLLEWTRIYRLVVLKLPLATQEQIEKQKVPYELVRRTVNRVAEDFTSKQVTRIFNEESNADMTTIRFLKYKKTIGTLIYNLSRPQNLMEVPDSILMDIKAAAQTVVNLANLEIDYREKNGGKKRFESLVEKEAHAIDAVQAMAETT